MAFELPVVVTNSGASAELIDGGAAGVAVAPADPSALAYAIATLLEDPGHAVALAERAREHAERYSIVVTAASTLALYNGLRATRALTQSQSPALSRSRVAEHSPGAVRGPTLARALRPARCARSRTRGAASVRYSRRGLSLGRPNQNACWSSPGHAVQPPRPAHCQRDLLPTRLRRAAPRAGPCWSQHLAALYWLTRNPRCTVWCHEPHPGNAAKLHTTLRGFEGRYHLVEGAVGSVAGQGRFTYDNSGRYGRLSNDEQLGDELQVEILSLAHELRRVEEHERRRPDLVKLDTEAGQEELLALVPPDIPVIWEDSIGRVRRDRSRADRQTVSRSQSWRCRSGAP